jgi:hypothetical protein
MKHLFTYLILIGFSSYIVAQTTKESDNFRYKMEDNKLKLEKTYFNLGNTYNTEVKKESSAIFNDTDEPMTITFSGVPKYISMSVTPNVIPAKSKGLIEMEYRVAENVNSEKKQNWGYQNSRFRVIVNGNTQNSKNNLNVRANIQEDYRNLSEEQLKKAPKIEFVETEFNFGTVTQGDKITHEFAFKNTGKSDLYIRNLKASCGCTAVSSTEEAIKKGETSSIKAVFNTRGKSNKQTKSITVTTNDPQHPTMVIKMVGEVKVPNTKESKAPTAN